MSNFIKICPIELKFENKVSQDLKYFESWSDVLWVHKAKNPKFDLEFWIFAPVSTNIFWTARLVQRAALKIKNGFWKSKKVR